MYIISLFVLVVAFIILTFFGGTGSVVYFIDLPSLLILLLITIPILVSTGLFKDFMKSFQLVMEKKKVVSLIQLKKSMEGVSFTIKMNFYVGALLSLYGFVQVMVNFDGLEQIAPRLAISMLAFLYAIAINIILLSIKYKLRAMILDFTQD